MLGSSLFPPDMVLLLEGVGVVLAALNWQREEQDPILREVTQPLWSSVCQLWSPWFTLDASETFQLALSFLLPPQGETLMIHSSMRLLKSSHVR